MFDCLQALRSARHYKTKGRHICDQRYFSGENNRTYGCEHWHINGIRVVEIQFVRMSKLQFLRGMIFVETVLSNDEERFIILFQ